MASWWSWAGSALGVAFLFWVGACIGSFLNVVAYRLPRGEGLFSPPSRCPSCETRLRWTQNLPIFGWLLLGGRCRFCRSRISAQYPAVELITALLFAFFFAAWFGETSGQAWFGGALRPAWADPGIARMWPMLLLVYATIASLIAMTLIDAKTFMIPLSIPWFLTALALVTHPLHAAALSARSVTPMNDGWTIPIPAGAHGVGLMLGGLAGVGACALLLKLRVIPRSFADFERWAAESQRAGAGEQAEALDGGTAQLGPLLMRVLYLTAPAVSLMAGGFALGLQIGRPLEATLLGTLVGLGIGVVMRRYAPGGRDDAPRAGSRPDQSTIEPEWIRYPHARREATKELLCLACIALFAALGWFLGGVALADQPPLWMRALAGASAGYLIGGGIVWLVRIFGTIGFGKEAMGMGDVHLLAAVGAALGWLDPVLAFFTAPFFGIAWVVISATLLRGKGGVAVAMPFGPHLAAGTIAVLLAWPLYDRLVGTLLGTIAAAP